MNILKDYKFVGYASNFNDHKKINKGEFLIPQGKKHPGSFGYKRKNHIHEGIDFYCNINTIVLSMTNGIVVDKGNFTGELVNSPWWNNTEYISILYKETIIVYGEIIVNKNIKIGDKIKPNQELGFVTPVLKRNSNGISQSMLHLETYDSKLYKEPLEWLNDKPLGLLSPLKFIQKNFKI